MGNATSRIRDPVELTNLAFASCVRFQTSGALKDINKAVEYSTAAISLTPDGDPQMLLRLTVLATSSSSRFIHLGERADLDKTIECWKQTISLTPQGDPELPARIATLGLSLNFRFQRFNEPEDLDEGIEFASQAVSLTPQSDPDLPDRLHSLGCLLITRFDKRGELEDLDNAIQHMSQAAWLAPEGHPESPSWLHKLGCAFNRRFNQLSNIADLDQAIKYTSQAVLAAPNGHTELLVWLNNLGAYLDDRFERLTEFQDLEKAIEYRTQAVSISPEDHPDLHIQLNNLGHSLLHRFEHLGDSEDLCKAVEYQRQAVSTAPSNHPEMTTWVSNLGELLRTRYQRFGEISDLDEAILRMSRIVSVAHQDHTGSPLLFNNLGLSFCSRFERLGEIGDLYKSVDYISQAVSLTPEGDPTMTERLNNLSHSLMCQYKELANIEDLDKSIEYIEKAVSLIPPGHLHRPDLLSNLGCHLESRFQRLGELVNLEKAIESNAQAVLLTPEGHPDLTIRLNNLSTSLNSRFKRLGKIQDLDEAIEHMSRGVSLTPHAHPEMAQMIRNLGHLYSDRSTLPGMTKDILQAAECFQKAAESSVGSLSCRLGAALEWARICAAHRISSSLVAYGRAMTLLPQLVWLESGTADRYRHTSYVGRLATEAAAAAIAMKEYQLAIEWLEEGRSIVWKQMLQLRTPFDELFAVDPTLAEELKQVARELDYARSPSSPGHHLFPSAASSEETSQQHRRLAEKWSELVEQARQLPGFNSFMRPHQACELMRAAQSGPVVLINVHEKSSDVLIILPGSTDIAHMPLKLSYNEAKNAFVHPPGLARSRSLTGCGFQAGTSSTKYELERTLAMLWTEVVMPVLDFLGYMRTPSTGELPHITWCPTGPLSLLPLHAAGDYNLGHMLYNYVVSSYTPTLSVLLAPPSSAPFSGILTVGQEFTPGMESLPGTVVELATIRKKSQGLVVTQLDGKLATPTAVLAGMEEHSWVHLACHASQNITDPIRSALYLHNGLLDLESITQKPLKHAELAFLSAGQTATGDKSMSEEAVHLAAGMLMAGYRTVIAAMWSIGDDDAPMVAEKVYEHLLEGGRPDSRRAAVALHKAMECLRGKVGVKEFEKWVPYVHIGL